jgi:tRNA pseudouridine38-40 synthase
MACKKDLDIAKMLKAAKYLEGTHDFSSFRATECQAKSPIKTLDSINIVKEDDFIILYFSAKSFLHHMVRNIVGTLKMVGEGKIAPEEMVKIIRGKR